ncbi:MAG TPA: SdrD B-like domain-containing protein [Anaerolineales bacterium]|jgi:hypothetical protein
MMERRTTNKVAVIAVALVLVAGACTCSPSGLLGGIGGGGNLGDWVWLDANGNGIQDEEETGVAGVTVRLLDETGGGVAETTTNGDGLYGFSDVEDGTYSLEFIPHDELSFTLMDQGQDDSLDSDARQTDGQTEPFSYSGGDLTRDAGLLRTASGPTTVPPTATPTHTPTPPASVPPEIITTYEHTAPGSYSEIVITINNLEPGATVSGNVSGPAVDGDGNFSGAADEYGTAVIRVRILQFGDYIVTIPELDYEFTVVVVAATATPPGS